MNIEPFLATVHEFQQSPISPDFYSIHPANTVITKYNNIIVDSPYISINKKTSARYVKPEYLKFVGDLFQQQVKLTLGQDYEITNIPSPDTARLRLVLGDLTLPTHQQAIVSSNAGFIPIGLKDSVIEAYLEDSLTGDLIGGVRDFRFGKQQNQDFLNGFTSIKYFRSVFAAWSGELRAVLDETLPESKKKQAAKKTSQPEPEELLYATPEQPVLDSLLEDTSKQDISEENTGVQDIAECSEATNLSSTTDMPLCQMEPLDTVQNP